MTDKPKLTNKQTRFAQGLVDGLSKKDAALLAGYSERSASSIATETLKNPVFQQALTQIMEEKGLTTGHIAERLFSLTTARGKDGHDDFTAQCRALDMALKVRGDFAPTRVTVDDSRDEAEINASFISLFQELVPGLIEHIQGKAIEKRVIEINPVEREKSKIIEINK
ncbi:MAG: hypothetical protein EHM79_06745 [Geobacter sp.]|nr:MAG: hypothetical protein EHM79_06745 [Geobacter sp.]